jgi:hypothetical protein
VAGAARKQCAGLKFRIGSLLHRHFSQLEARMTIANIHKSEAEDFEAELRRHKRSEDEFEIVATPQMPYSQQAGVISPYGGTITIKNKKSGAERTYPTGSGSSWVVDFSADLEARVL